MLPFRVVEARASHELTSTSQAIASPVNRKEGRCDVALDSAMQSSSERRTGINELAAHTQ